MAGLENRFSLFHVSSAKVTRASAIAVLGISCGLAVGQSQAGFGETAEEIGKVPYYAGPVHVRCILKKWDARTKEQIQAQHDEYIKEDIDHWKKQGLSPAQIEDAAHKFDARWAEKETPEQRKLELWSDGVRWVLIETDPTVKADVFSGESPGRTVWFCDGRALATITSNGFECILLRKGVLSYSQPDTPPLGIGYCAMPTAIRQVIRASRVPKLVRFDGWQPAAVPGYVQYTGDPLDTGDMDEDPTRFTNYVPGYVKMDAEHKVSNINVGLVSHPQEMWTFSDFRNISGRQIAFQTLWNDFDPEVRTNPRMKRQYSVQSVETDPVNSSVFALNRYLKPGAHVQIPFDPEQAPDVEIYKEGESLEQTGASKGVGKSSATLANVGTGLSESLLTGYQANSSGSAKMGTPCDVVIGDALAKAVKQHKRLFVEFGSSWCKPCKALKATLDAPDMSHLLGKYLLFASIDYDENKDHQGLENPGAVQWMERHNVVPSLPAYAIVEPDGSVAVCSSCPSRKQKLNPISGAPFHYSEIPIVLHFFAEGVGMTSAELVTLRHILESDIEATGKGSTSS